jgi:hypothetical protein
MYKQANQQALQKKKALRTKLSASKKTKEEEKK